MIKEYNIKHNDEGFPIYLSAGSKNPLFKDLPDYHFDRDEMCKVFDDDFAMWLYDHINEHSDYFPIWRWEDEIYILHRDSGTMVGWYKHIGRCNICNKKLTIEDLKEFKRMLLADFGYVEV